MTDNAGYTEDHDRLPLEKRVELYRECKGKNLKRERLRRFLAFDEKEGLL